MPGPEITLSPTFNPFAPGCALLSVRVVQHAMRAVRSIVLDRSDGAESRTFAAEVDTPVLCRFARRSLYRL